MGKSSIYVIAVLTLVWVILHEHFAVSTIAAGIFISTGCVYFCNRFLPIPESLNINPARFVVYLLYLIAQVYLAGIYAIKIIVTGAGAEIITVKTRISGLFLRSILANSITLVPGSVSLELKDNTITALWLTKTNADPEYAKNTAESAISKLETMLLKVQD